MVRSYLPQGRNKSLTTNTNFPPQGDIVNGDTPFIVEESFNDGLGSSGIILYNDGTEVGKVIVDEINPDAYNLLEYKNFGVEAPLDVLTKTPQQAVFFPDGTGFIILNNNGDSIDEYELLTTDDITTIHFVRKIEIQDFVVVTAPRGLSVTNNGSNLILTSNNTLFQFSLPNGTATNFSVFGISYDGIKLNLGMSGIRAIKSRSDTYGTLFVLDSNLELVKQYDMPNPGLVDGMSAIADDEHDVSGLDDEPFAMDFKFDGSEMYIIGKQNYKISQVDLPNNWTFNGAVDNLIQKTNSLFGILGLAGATSLNFTDDGVRTRLARATSPVSIVELSV